MSALPDSLVASTFIAIVTYRQGLQCILTITPMCYRCICVSFCIVIFFFRMFVSSRLVGSLRNWFTLTGST